MGAWDASVADWLQGVGTVLALGVGFEVLLREQRHERDQGCPPPLLRREGGGEQDDDQRHEDTNENDHGPADDAEPPEVGRWAVGLDPRWWPGVPASRVTPGPYDALVEALQTHLGAGLMDVHGLWETIEETGSFCPVGWPPDAQYRACLEGWDIFFTAGSGVKAIGGSGHPMFEIEALDYADEDENMLPTDEEAWEHVVRKACEGGELHTSALLFIARNAPDHLDDLREVAERLELRWPEFLDQAQAPVSEVYGGPSR